MFGHSFGGATCCAGMPVDNRELQGRGRSRRLSRTEPWCRKVYTSRLCSYGANRPRERSRMAQQAIRDTETIATRWPHDDYQVTVNGMRHFNFSDFRGAFARPRRETDRRPRPH